MQHLLHQEGRAVGQGLPGAFAVLGLVVDDAPVAVNHLRHHHGFLLASVGRHGGVGVHQLQQVHVRGPQCQGRLCVEARMDTHGVGRLDDVFNTHLQTRLHGNAVDALGKGGTQRHRVAREVAVGIVGSPQYFLALLLVKHLQPHVVVEPAVAR